MRFYVAYLTLCCVLFAIAFGFADPSALREREEVMFVAADGTEKGDMLEASESENLPIEKEEEEGCAASERAATDAGSILFTEGGVYRADMSVGIEESVVRSAERKIADSCGSEGVDYALFGSEGRMAPLREALNERELSYVFSETIRAIVKGSPIRVELREIGYDVRQDVLVVDMRLTAYLEELSKKYPLVKMPSTAVFRCSALFMLKNSEISVQSDGFSLDCESFSLSPSLLEFACNVLFGTKDPQSFFSSVIKNVFVNVGIYR